MNTKEIAQLVQSTDVFLLDMDGTIYRGETPIGDMQNTLAAIRRAGKKIVYCTNNSSKTAVTRSNPLWETNRVTIETIGTSFLCGNPSCF